MRSFTAAPFIYSKRHREIAAFTPELEHNESWTRTHNVTPTLTGENMRLTYLLYRGGAPEDPTVDNAYREVHLWVNVSEPDE